MYLYEELESFKKRLGANFYQNLAGDSIFNNLNSFITLREYQKESIGRFVDYFENFENKPTPLHLLFNMATGSGKTVVMASLIIYLYTQGYRNFIFFVNASNIIEKTKANFLHKGSIKYLFNENLVINDRPVTIKQVSNFQGVNSDDINIIFTTIQGLHTKINNPSEEDMTIDDFTKGKIVIISDEAHHINTLTKSLAKKKLSSEENVSWESTAAGILNRHDQNIMLEFTATIDRKNPEIVKKYEDKTIFRYDLKQFRLDRFSKEVKILRADITMEQRVLQAIILSHYRRKVAESYKIGLKPVVLIKSKDIHSSEVNYNQFLNILAHLTTSDIKQLRNISQKDDMNKARSFFSRTLSDEQLIKELQIEFDKTKIIEVNSKKQSEEKQLLVNSLEDTSNQIRLIFAVDMLNEGWDVLNLFDIVRLDESRTGSSGTIKEAQLIGRGARYYPFSLSEEQDLFTRKYDNDLSNELRILEELHYHCINDPKYISELKIELEKVGIYDNSKQEILIKVKENFKKSEYYKTGFIYANSRIINDRKGVKNIFDANVKREYTHKLYTGNTNTITIFKDSDISLQEIRSEKRQLNSLDKHLILSSIETIPTFEFRNLKKYVPSLDSIDSFINNQLSSISINIEGGSYDQLNISMKTQLLYDVFNQIAKDLVNGYTDYIGTTYFSPIPISQVVKDKQISVTISSENNDSKVGRPLKEDIDFGYLDLNNKKRYIYDENYGTSEEKSLIKFINEFMNKLEEKYTNIYLLRNEKIFQLYTFGNNCKTLEPDFLLMATSKTENASINYQLFIEPKGNHLLKTDERKEEFLKQIKPGDYSIHKVFGSQKYELYGLCFYNDQRNQQIKDFEEEFTDVLSLD